MYMITRAGHAVLCTTVRSNTRVYTNVWTCRDPGVCSAMYLDLNCDYNGFGRNASYCIDNEDFIHRSNRSELQ